MKMINAIIMYNPFVLPPPLRDLLLIGFFLALLAVGLALDYWRLWLVGAFLVFMGWALIKVWKRRRRR